jgi:dipeptidyl aminopeptidase/acylaminoacyl peptidase
MSEVVRGRKRAVTAEALVSIRSISDIAFHPGGQVLMFTVDEADFDKSQRVNHLFCAEYGRMHPQQMTWSEAGEHSALWSEDGKWVAMFSARGENLEEDQEEPKEQIWLLPEIGEAKKLTTAGDGVRQFQWMPDSKQIVYLASEPKAPAIRAIEEKLEDRKRDADIEDADKPRQQLWLINIDSSEKKLLYAGDYGLSHFEISPDGKWIAFSTNYTGEGRHEHRYDIVILNVITGETEVFVKRQNCGMELRFSPDSKTLAFLACNDPNLGFSQRGIFTIPIKGGDLVNLTEGLDRDVESFEWSRYDKQIYLAAATGVYLPLYKLNPKTKEITLIACENQVIGDFVPGKRGVAMVVQDAENAPEVYALRKDGTLRRITDFNRDLTRHHCLAKQEVVRWKSDEWEIEGLLVYPLDFKQGERYPMIVSVHGGPAGTTTNTLRNHTMAQLFAAHGYAVLLPNYRGSSGYSADFQIADLRDIGGGDFRDIMNGVDWAIDAGIADPKQIGLIGASYGGYMTNWAITQTDRFAAAVSLFGIFNLFTDYSNSAFPRWEREYLGAFYWEDPQIYFERSPFRYVNQIKTPVLIMHGEEDANTFISNSKEMYQALKEKGDVQVEFVRFPREGHGNSEPNHRVDEARRWLEWFDRYLKPAKVIIRRVGDLIKMDGWELRIVGAEPVEFGKKRGENNPYLQVEFALSNRTGKMDDFTLNLDEVWLSDTNGRAYRPVGVPVNMFDTMVFIKGRHIQLNVAADKDTGVVAAPISALFDLPRKGGEYLLHIREFPPVRVFVNPVRRKPLEKSDGAELPVREKSKLHKRVE